MVDFSQTTEPFAALMSFYADRSVWNPLGVVRWKKKKKGSIALEYAEGISPFGSRMLCQKECCLKGGCLA